MPGQRPTPRYNCTQAELYAICFIMWKSYGDNQLDFETFKTIYTAQFGTDALAEIEAAKNLPDFQARNEASETAYINMGTTAKQALKAWRSLRSYIKSGFPENLQKPQIEAAGEAHYMKALNRNWSETELMLTSAINYIGDHTAALTSGGMPAGFPTTVSDLNTAFMSHYNTFTDSGQDEHEGTDEKITANNDIYDKTMAMGDDGQLIYEDNAAKRERFTFTRVKELITNTTGSNAVPADTIIIGAYAFNTENELPEQGVTLTILNPPDGQPVSAVTNEEGLLELKIEGYQPNSTNSLDYEVSHPNFPTQTGSAEFVSGQYYSFEIPLTPEPAPPSEP